jgi:PLAC8 family
LDIGVNLVSFSQIFFTAANALLSRIDIILFNLFLPSPCGPGDDTRDFLGGPGARPSVSNTCMIVTGIYFFVIVADLILSSVSGSTQCGGTGGLEEYDPDAGEYRIKCDDGTWEDKTSTTEITSAVYSVIAVLFWLYMLVVVCRTRKHMREKYNIPQGSCGALDDCCCSCWCGCCAVSCVCSAELFSFRKLPSPQIFFSIRFNKWRATQTITINLMLDAAAVIAAISVDNKPLSRKLCNQFGCVLHYMLAWNSEIKENTINTICRFLFHC